MIWAHLHEEAFRTFGGCPQFTTGVGAPSGRATTLPIRVRMPRAYRRPASSLGGGLQISPDTGFDADHIAVFKLSFPPPKYPTDTSERLFVQLLTERLRAIPGVRRVGVTSVLPFSGNWATASIMVEGQTRLTANGIAQSQ